MPPQDVGSIADLLERRFGDALRLVAHVDLDSAGSRPPGDGEQWPPDGAVGVDDYEVLHVRDDVADRVTEERVAEVVESFVMESMNAPMQESVYGSRLRSSVRDFVDTDAVFVHLGEMEGVHFVVDGNVYTADRNLVDDILDAEEE